MHILFPLRRAAALAVLLFAITLLAPPLIAQEREDEMAVGPNIEKEDFFRPGIAPVRAPAGYDLTIVYFMDYQCPSCRQYTPDVARVLAEDRKVRVIYRDTPIISDLSTVAARAAIASAFQGRHAAFHHALMTTKGRLSEAAIRAAADSAKVDWPRLQRDLKARGEAIDEQIGRNVELAVATGILGTPAFIVGERLSNGALDYASLKAEIADARASQAKAGAGAKPAAGGTTADTPPADTPPVANTVADEPKAAAAAVAAPALFQRSDPKPSAAAQTDDAVVSTWAASPLQWIAALLAIGAIGGGVRWHARRRRNTRAPPDAAGQ